MTRRRLILGSLLALSLGANAYLGFKRADSHPAPRPTLKPRVQPQPPRGLPEFKWSSAVASVPERYAGEDRAALEQRLVEAEARIAELLHADERYPLEERSIETEEKVKPYLNQVFKPLAGTDPKYRIECHGKVCKIESDIDVEWTLPLQRMYPGREMFGSMQFGRSGTYVELSEEPIGFVEGKQVLGMILSNALETSDCEIASARGTLRLMFSVDRAARTIRVGADGSLATTEVGLCFRKAIDETIARGFVSPNLTLPPDSIELTFPLKRQ